MTLKSKREIRILFEVKSIGVWTRREKKEFRMTSLLVRATLQNHDKLSF